MIGNHGRGGEEGRRSGGPGIGRPVDSVRKNFYVKADAEVEWEEQGVSITEAVQI
jgi:hypothetical protein